MIEEFPQEPSLEIVTQHMLPPEDKWEIPGLVLDILFCLNAHGGHKAKWLIHPPPVSTAI